MFSMVVAIASNGVIGRKTGGIPWSGQMPSDIEHFHSYLEGYTIMGSDKTLGEMKTKFGEKHRIVITLDKKPNTEHETYVGSIEEAVAQDIPDEEIVIVGGGSIFAQMLDHATLLHVTEIHHDAEGDVVFPEIDKSKWKEVSRESFKADDKNKYDYDFVEYVKI